MNSPRRLRPSTLICRGLTFYRRTHVGVLAGAAIGAAVLTGALVLGDSVRGSLYHLAAARLGKVAVTVSSRERLFRASLGERLETPLGTPAAAVMMVPGIGSAEGGAVRVNRLQILGVDKAFWAMAPDPAGMQPPKPDEAVVSRQVAKRLHLAVGDEFLVRAQALDTLPRDAPIATAGRQTIALRVRLAAIATNEQFGRFSLRASQVPPLNVYLDREWLTAQMGMPGRANLVLLEGNDDSSLTPAAVEDTLAHVWQLADAGLELHEVPPGKTMELRSERVFLSPAVANASLAVPSAQGVLTYFVREFRAGARSVPYSFVAAPGPPLASAELGDRDIVVNSWLAEDLGIASGDDVELRYFVLDGFRGLKDAGEHFRVKRVVPIEGAAADQTLMPAFPGLAEAHSCRDWDPGMPVDLQRIRDRDEAYWKRYRGTPKAFIKLSTARRLWGNRFGSLTAVRYADASDPPRLAEELRAKLSPGALGFVVSPAQQEAHRAAGQSVDFGQLFLGLSFFIVMAAALLTALLFVFGVEQRAPQTGLLLAVGLPRRLVHRLALGEAAVLALSGGLLGAALGLAYNRVLIWCLVTVWQGAVGPTELQMYVKPGTLVIGAFAGAVVALLATYLSLRGQGGRGIVALLQGASGTATRAGKRRPWISLAVAVLCGLGTVLILVTTNPGRGKDAAGAFFGAGALLLVTALILCHRLLGLLESHTRRAHLSPLMLGIRGSTRRRGRSLAVIALLACGIFLVVAVAANRLDPGAEAGSRSSGTGGYALYAEATVPILHDLNSLAGRQKLGLAGDWTGITVTGLRAKVGDDASCLNLNRAQHPRLLGVPVDAFAAREAFTFASLASGCDADHPWTSLSRLLPDGSIPAIADQSVIVWGLGKSIGDSVEYVDETGETVTLTFVGGLANSIFQGSILIADRFFVDHFPSISGSQVLLVDAPDIQREALAKRLSLALQDAGLELQSAGARLAEFHRVENTYLAIFLALGGLGLVIGCVGLGVVVLRNVMERRGELALLRAVGFSRRAVRRLLLTEHWLLLLLGLVCGTVTGLLAVLPALAAPGGHVPVTSLIWVLAGILVNGGIWIFAATTAATRGKLLDALRQE